MSKSQVETPEWRQFEQLVARIEKDARAYGLKVTSPDYIKCKITGRLREVDASICWESNSSTILMTIECRRRKKREDVTWIEQLATKMKNIGAECTIAVSSTGFSSDAAKIALDSGIELRCLSELSIEEINKLINLDFVLFTHKRCSLVSVGIRKFCSRDWTLPKEGEIDFFMPPNISADEKIFLHTVEGHRWSINDLWLQWQEAKSPYCGLEKSATPVVQTVCFPYPGNVIIEFSGECVRLGDVLLSVALSLEVEKVDLFDATRVGYRGDGVSLQRVEFSSCEKEGLQLSLQTDSESSKPEDVRVRLDMPVQER